MLNRQVEFFFLYQQSNRKQKTIWKLEPPQSWKSFKNCLCIVEYTSTFTWFNYMIPIVKENILNAELHSLGAIGCFPAWSKIQENEKTWLSSNKISISIKYGSWETQTLASCTRNVACVHRATAQPSELFCCPPVTILWQYGKNTKSHLYYKSRFHVTHTVFL